MFVSFIALCHCPCGRASTMMTWTQPGYIMNPSNTTLRCKRRKGIWQSLGSYACNSASYKSQGFPALPSCTRTTKALPTCLPVTWKCREMCFCPPRPAAAVAAQSTQGIIRWAVVRWPCPFHALSLWKRRLRRLC